MCDELKDYDYDPDFPFQSRGRFYVADDVDAAIAELKERDRKTKRALWLAREARAKATWQKILRDAGIFFAIGKCKEWDFYNTKQKKWQRVETKCAAKAKEFV